MKTIHANGVNGSILQLLCNIFSRRPFRKLACAKWGATGSVFLLTIREDLMTIFLISLDYILKHHEQTGNSQHVMSIQRQIARVTLQVCRERIITQKQSHGFSLNRRGIQFLRSMETCSAKFSSLKEEICTLGKGGARFE